MSTSVHPNEVTVEGTIVRIVLQKERFRIVKAKLDTGNLISVVGQFPLVAEGSRVRIVGRRERHDVYGEQIRATSVLEISHHTLEGLTLYLSGGTFPGVGKVMAARVVEFFGEATLDVLSQHPERLKEVPKLSAKAAESLMEEWKKRAGIHDLMVFMREAGLGQALAEKIFEKYGVEAMTVVRRQPYRLAQEVDGIGFLTADRLGASVGIAKDSMERIKAAIRHAVKTGQDERGDTAFTAQMLENGVRKALVEDFEGIGKLFEEGLGSLVADKEVSEDTFGGIKFYYRPRTMRREEALANRIWDIAHTPPNEAVFVEDAERAIEEFEEASGLQLGDKQKEAIVTAAESSIMVVTGGPGTGKTTILKGILHAFKNAKLNSTQASPTGRAAKRMQEATGEPSQTIHRLLRYSPAAEEFRCHRRNPVAPICEACFGSGKMGEDSDTQCHHCKGTGSYGKPYDVVIIDETSMLDLHLAERLFDAVADGSRLILVGDVDQLPSVGAGCVLRDIIDCGIVPVVRLDRIYRQVDAERSLITDNAHGILRGEFPQSDKDRDFLMLKDHSDIVAPDGTLIKSGGEVARDKLMALVKALMEKKGYKAEDIQVLVPQHKGDAGNSELNRALQAAINPPPENGESYEHMNSGSVFRKGDRVMHLRNDYELGVFNGEVGYITRSTKESLAVCYDDPDGSREVVYKGDALSMLKLSYCSTIHKAQGSEYPVVIVVLLAQAYWMLNRNLIYTAITRGQRLVVVITDGGAKSVLWGISQKGSDRVTTLSERIKQLEGT